MQLALGLGILTLALVGVAWAVARSSRRRLSALGRAAQEVQASARTLSEVSREIHTGSGRLAAQARELARGFEEQVGQVLRTSDTTRELSLSVERVSRGARDVFQSASAAAERAARGAEAARRATAGIGDLAESTSSAAAAIDGFRLKTGEIGTIVASITSISHQTHLLSINAAIEAARAGAEGRGFGVVAEEVAFLADDVRRFAEQISAINEQIVLGSHVVAEEFRRSATAVAELRGTVERSASSFDGILSAVRGTATRVGEISQLATEQQERSVEVVRSLERVSRLTEHIARSSDETSQATQAQIVAIERLAQGTARLAATSDELRGLVSGLGRR